VRLFDSRMETLAAIGYGGDQVQGELRADLLYGVRGYFSDSQGPFVRAGFLGDFRGSRSFSSSYAAGAGEAGYQYMVGSLGLEIGTQGGLTFRSSALVGAFVNLAASKYVVLRAEWQRFYETSGAVADVLSDRGCVTVARVVPVCLALWSSTSPTSAATYSYGELSVGLGAVFTSMTGQKN
jgi:hypothetical protein